jgi:glycopeptide antibiotics resistance protein
VIHYNPSLIFQITGNAVMLTPFAFTMLYFKWVKSNKQAIWYSLLGSIGIEFVQFLQSILALVFDIDMGRSSDIDDVILNTISVAVGVGCYFFLWAKIENLFSQVRKKSERGHFFSEN